MIDERTRWLLDTRLAREQVAHRLPSVAAGLVRHGELIWSGGCGSVSGRVPDHDTQYRSGSITKTFVAVMVLRLRDAGRLRLTDPVGDYVDVARAGSLTIGHLLSHTSGLRAETAGPWWERTAGGSLELLASGSLGSDAARTRPGRRHHYSNVGYALLGALVTQLHGKPWHEVAAAELLAPLRMTRTTTRPSEPFAPGFAVHPHADLLLPEPEHDAGAMAPAGQFWTTVGDLATWAGFLAGGASGEHPELLSPATLAQMREPIGINDTAGQPWASGYGLGLQLWNTGGRRYFGHSGSMPGFLAIAQIAADSGDAAIVMCNSTTGFGPALATDLLHVLTESYPPRPAPWRPADVPPDVLALLGTWYWGPAQHIMRQRGDSLELRREGEQGRVLTFRRDGAGGWAGVDGYQASEPLVPVTGPDGSVVALDIGSFIYTREPYDPAAPVPGGVDPAGWRADPPGR